MGRTVSGEELRAGQHEFAYNKNNRLLQFLADGKRAFKEGCKAVVSVKDSLVARATYQRNRLMLGKAISPEFKKHAGKTADAKRIFAAVIEKNINEKVAAL